MINIEEVAKIIKVELTDVSVRIFNAIADLIEDDAKDHIPEEKTPIVSIATQADEEPQAPVQQQPVVEEARVVSQEVKASGFEPETVGASPAQPATFERSTTAPVEATPVMQEKNGYEIEIEALKQCVCDLNDELEKLKAKKANAPLEIYDLPQQEVAPKAETKVEVEITEAPKAVEPTQVGPNPFNIVSGDPSVILGGPQHNRDIGM